ncbi:transmembrane protein 42-like isoform X2 [Acropora palmata]|uniref:transmembrane protein 42-like isoform X2 n=1 Tax=Acropora palmata TaxID=6131 RepID=UPI003DA17F13
MLGGTTKMVIWVRVAVTILTGYSSFSLIVIATRMFSFILVFVFNAMMWTLFVKSLRGSTSSATATVSNTGSNFISTAFLGCLLFGETLSMRWLFGTSLILTGLILVHYNSEPLTKDHLDVKKD